MFPCLFFIFGHGSSLALTDLMCMVMRCCSCLENQRKKFLMVPRGVKPYFVHLLPNLFPIARGRVKYLIGVLYKEFDTLLQKS
jgi:hypothetical protein